MVDNLRRSVTPLTCVLALLAGWALPFEAALVWTLFFLGTIALPSVSPVLASAGARHPGIGAGCTSPGSFPILAARSRRPC